MRVFLSLFFLVIAFSAGADHPNVVLILTDDQGYGDFGVTGNPVIATPHIDAMAARSVWMTNFYVSPVCSPTRASLMTGRYNYRTRVVDTFLGRSMMDPGEETIAELLRDAGYATGIFGKWHLGDCYPMRAMDQGFEESLVLRGGGLAQPADPPDNARRYTDPVLVHNGALEHTKGYCTDVFFGAAIDWMKRAHTAGKPFFAYIAPNAPHEPLHDVPEDLRKQYAQKDMAQLLPHAPGQTPRRGPATDGLERLAAMITNIDDNVGKLLAALDESGLSENTLVIFLSDNGPSPARYAGPFRGQKGEVYEGGVRTPFWMLWPGKLKPGYKRDEPVAHIDVMPTILDVCGVMPPGSVKLDGQSFWGLAEGKSTTWPLRPLVIQTHRGDVPAARHQFMIREGDWKLLHASGFGREAFSGELRYELYKVTQDPGETKNLAAEQPDRVAQLLAKYDAWFEMVSHTRPDNYAPPRIHIGTVHENPVMLTRQDWRGGTWADDSIGYWFVTFEAGRYDVKTIFTARKETGTVELRIGDVVHKAEIAAGADACRFEDLELPQGDVEFHMVVHHGDASRGVYQVEIRKR